MRYYLVTTVIVFEFMILQLRKVCVRLWRFYANPDVKNTYTTCQTCVCDLSGKVERCEMPLFVTERKTKYIKGNNFWRQYN